MYLPKLGDLLIQCDPKFRPPSPLTANNMNCLMASLIIKEAMTAYEKIINAFSNRIDLKIVWKVSTSGIDY